MRLLSSLFLAPVLLSAVACTQPSNRSDAGSNGPADAGLCGFTEVQAPEPQRHTPRWAFEPWISKDISTGADTRAFVQGFRDRDIPVGVLVLDSPWETDYNTYTPNPSRYPEFGQMVADLRADNIRTVLWTTQMMNEESYDLELGGDTYLGPAEGFTLAFNCNFFVNDGAVYFWWKGNGCGVDFFNPAARAWWHGLQEQVLSVGVAGFKLDFGDDYVTTPMVKTAAGVVPHQQYSEAYYQDFLAHGQRRLGREEFVTMVRPWDKSYQWTGRFYARPEHAPVAWVGDNRRDWIGLEDALDHMFRSVAEGYVVVGSDIGGYLDRDDLNVAGPEIPFSTENFIRWTALGALNPFMQLHGRANITPWTVPSRADESVAAWYYWGWVHHALIPFFYSLAEEAYAGAPVIMRPVGEPQSWPGDYRYLLGEALLVAPILNDSGTRDVGLPAGARWLPFFDLAATPLQGGTTLTAYSSQPTLRLPVFLREGAILPLNVERTLEVLGDAAQSGSLTVLAWPGTTASSFALHDEDDVLTTLSARRDGNAAVLELSRRLRSTYARVRAEGVPTGVTVDGNALSAVADRAALHAAAQGYVVDGNWAWVKVPAGGSAVIRVAH